MFGLRRFHPDPLEENGNSHAASLSRWYLAREPSSLPHYWKRDDVFIACGDLAERRAADRGGRHSRDGDQPWSWSELREIGPFERDRSGIIERESQGRVRATVGSRSIEDGVG